MANEIMQLGVSTIMNRVKRLGPGFVSMLWGTPGIGKTQSVLETFGTDYEICLVLAGCSEPTDISGVPFEYKYKDEPVATQILAPIWAYHASYEYPEELRKKMVIFFDDLPTGHEQVQAACFKVCGEKKVGNLQLRDDVYIIGAGNNVEDKSGAFEMPLALANRMIHYYAKCDVDGWLEWASGRIHPRIVAFIRRHNPSLNRFDEIVKLKASEKAFATPRTWEMLSKAMLVMDPDGGIGDWLYEVALGCIGSGIGLEFTTFAKNTASLVDPEEIVKDPANARIPKKTEVDVLYATITALEYHINKPDNWKHWDKALQYVLRDELEAEFGLLIAKAATLIALRKLPEDQRAAAVKNPWFQKMYNLYGTYLANPMG